MKTRSIIGFATALLISSCGTKKEAAASEPAAEKDNIVTFTEAQEKTAGISTGSVSYQDMALQLKVNGKVDVPPQNMVSISVPLGGYLKNTGLLPGMHVNKGAVIAEMEDQQYIQLQQDYLTAKARIGFLEKEYIRQKELNATQASSDKQFQQTEADYRSQQILIAALAEKLHLAGINTEQLTPGTISRSVFIKAPINGYVTKVNVNIGKYVSPTEVLFELVNPADIHLALTVFEKDLSGLQIGQQVSAFTNNEPNRKHRCEVILIGKSLSAERSTEVHCHFEDYDPTLIPGTYMNALINLVNKQSPVIPAEAIVQYQTLPYAFIKKSAHTYEMIPVKTGVTQNGMVQLTDSSLIGKEIVTKGSYSLLGALKNKSSDE